eukprot:jgi/Hompol1/1962/HPOL_005798-RA
MCQILFFVIFQPVPDSKTKIKGEISHVLFPNNIKHLKSSGLWPSVFDESVLSADTEQKSDDDEEEASSDDDNDDDLFVNNNRGTGLDDDDDDEE